MRNASWRVLEALVLHDWPMAVLVAVVVYSVARIRFGV